MKISTNTKLNYTILQNQNEHSKIIAKINNQDFTDNEQNNHFMDYLSFTGTVNKLNVVQIGPLNKLLKDLINFKGDNFEFAKYTFNKMKKYFNYEDLIKKNLKLVDIPEDDHIGTSFNPATGEFEMDNHCCSTISRCEIAAALRHEFEHFFQFERMFRSEEIGIERFAKENRINIIKEFNIEDYITGEKIDYEASQKYIDSYTKDFEKIDMDFWRRIIDKKGTLKKSSAEAEKAREEFEGFINLKPYIDMSNYKDKGHLPIRQKTKYYDFHEIGTNNYYWRNPIEILARKAQKDFLDEYLKLSKESYIQNEQIVEDQLRYSSIEKFMNILQDKFENNNLPDRFKAYIYDEITSEFLGANSDDIGVIDCIKKVCAELKNWTKTQTKNKLLKFKDFLKTGNIRLNSQEETNAFMEYVKNF